MLPIKQLPKSCGGRIHLACEVEYQLINIVIPFRASDEEQLQGLDVSECGLEAYPEFKRAI